MLTLSYLSIYAPKDYASLSSIPHYKTEKSLFYRCKTLGNPMPAGVCLHRVMSIEGAIAVAIVQRFNVVLVNSRGPLLGPPALLEHKFSRMAADVRE
jgi:hypothetical protein